MALSTGSQKNELLQSSTSEDTSGKFNLGTEEGLKWKEIIRILSRRRKLIAITALTITSAMTLQLSIQRIFHPVYQGSFSLLIKDPINNNTSAQNRSESNTNFESLALNSINNDLQTLIAVMRSYLVLEPVAKKTGISENILASRISITPEGGGRRNGINNVGAGIIKVSLNGKDPEEDRVLLSELANTYLKTAQRQRQQRLRDGLAFLDQQAPALEEKTAIVLNELEVFRKQNRLIDAVAEASTAEKNLAKQEEHLLNLKNTRRSLQQVRTQVSAGNLSSSGFQGSISSGQSSASGVAASTAGSSLSGSLNITGIDPGLVEQLTSVEEALAEARSTYQANSSVVQSLEQKKAQLEPLLLASQLQAIDTALQVNADQINFTELELNRLNQQFLRQPALIKAYEKLLGRLELVQGNLAALTSAQESFRLELAQNSVPWRLLSPPRMNPNPIEPMVGRGLLKAIFVGLISGIGIGLLRDRFDHVFHNPEEVKEDLGLALLGHIPHVEFFQGVREDKRFLLSELDSAAKIEVNEEKADPKYNNYQRFFYQEAFRNLFTSIRFLNSDTPLKTVALTSSLPAEGKSLVNVLLAKTLSEMGQRVLLIDADLRKPQMHVRLGLNNLSGLSNLLAEDQKRWEDLLQNVPGYENWKVLTAGRRPPDPTRLLSSKRMQSLVKDLVDSSDFDFVLFDTPPVLGLADAALVAEHCDGLMLLVSLERVDRGLPKESVNRILSSGAPLLGLVTKGIKPSKESRSSYGYGQYGYGKYGYRYGYGYGAYDSSWTYAHYANPDDENSINQKANAQTKSSAWRQKFREKRRNFMRWIDS